ncbi:hypothetical protein [Roseobacter sp.]|uniref:hypothetical protein n=1 Tax=Roseobacter sp. TaxID=1907202 RepID=UPI003296E37C
MARFKTSTSLVLLLCAIPAFSFAKAPQNGVQPPETLQKLHDHRHDLQARLDAASAFVPLSSDDPTVAQWNNWSNWSNFWNNWNNWANW